MRLYEITQDIAELEELINNEELSEEEITEVKSIIESVLNEKAEQIAYVIKNKESDIKAIKEEEKRLKEKRKSVEKSAERLKSYVLENLLMLDKKKIKTSVGDIAIRKSQAVEINTDVNVLDDRFKRVKTTVEADKTALKEAIKNGEVVDGVEIVENYSLNVR